MSHDSTEEAVLRVSGSTPPEQLAGAVMAAVLETGPPVLRAIGAGAVSQAVKGLIITSQYAAGRGMRLSFIPGFETVVISGDEKTAISFRVQVD